VLSLATDSDDSFDMLLVTCSVLDLLTVDAVDRPDQHNWF